MSYEQDEMTRSYDEDDDCLSLTADNDLVPLTPPEQLQIQQQLQSPQIHHILHPQQYQTQGLLQQQPMQARHGHHHPMQGSTRQPSPAPTLVITTMDTTAPTPQVLNYSGPTEVVHTLDWTPPSKPETPPVMHTHYVYADLYARNPGGKPELPFILSINSNTPPGSWHTNSKFFTRLLKMAATQASIQWPFKMFLDEGYQIVLRKPEFLYYHKNSDNLKVFHFYHPMDKNSKARAPKPYMMVNGQQPYSKLTVYVDVEFRYQPKLGHGINDPMIRSIIDMVQKAKVQWITAATATAATPATTSTPPPPSRTRSRSRSRTRKRQHTDEQPDLRQELTTKRAEGREARPDERHQKPEGRRWR